MKCQMSFDLYSWYVLTLTLCSPIHSADEANICLANQKLSSFYLSLDDELPQPGIIQLLNRGKAACVSTLSQILLNKIEELFQDRKKVQLRIDL